MFSRTSPIRTLPHQPPEYNALAHQRDVGRGPAPSRFSPSSPIATQHPNSRRADQSAPSRRRPGISSRGNANESKCLDCPSAKKKKKKKTERLRTVGPTIAEDVRCNGLPNRRNDLGPVMWETVSAASVESSLELVSICATEIRSRSRPRDRKDHDGPDDDGADPPPKSTTCERFSVPPLTSRTTRPTVLSIGAAHLGCGPPARFSRNPMDNVAGRDVLRAVGGRAIAGRFRNPPLTGFHESPSAGPRASRFPDFFFFFPFPPRFPPASHHSFTCAVHSYRTPTLYLTPGRSSSRETRTWKIFLALPRTQLLIATPRPFIRPPP